MYFENKIQRLKNKYNTFERGESMKFKFSIKLATISLIGNIIIAIGVSTCRISQMGIDPFTSMTTGISSLLNIPLGVFQGSVNAILFLILILLSRSNLKLYLGNI